MTVDASPSTGKKDGDAVDRLVNAFKRLMGGLPETPLFYLDPYSISEIFSESFRVYNVEPNEYIVKRFAESVMSAKAYAVYDLPSAYFIYVSDDADDYTLYNLAGHIAIIERFKLHGHAAARIPAYHATPEAVYATLTMLQVVGSAISNIAVDFFVASRLREEWYMEEARRANAAAAESSASAALVAGNIPLSTLFYHVADIYEGRVTRKERAAIKAFVENPGRSTLLGMWETIADTLKALDAIEGAGLIRHPVRSDIQLFTVYVRV